jgi:hypothetical protein
MHQLGEYVGSAIAYMVEQMDKLLGAVANDPSGQACLAILTVLAVVLMIREIWCWFWKTSTIAYRVTRLQHKLTAELAAVSRQMSSAQEALSTLSRVAELVEKHLDRIGRADATANGQRRPRPPVVQPGKGEQPQAASTGEGGKHAASGGTGRLTAKS